MKDQWCVRFIIIYHYFRGFIRLGMYLLEYEMEYSNLDYGQ